MEIKRWDARCVRAGDTRLKWHLHGDFCGDGFEVIRLVNDDLDAILEFKSRGVKQRDTNDAKRHEAKRESSGRRRHRGSRREQDE
jgi:hypothetical protein